MLYRNSIAIPQLKIQTVSIPFPSFFCKYLCSFAYLSKIQTISMHLFVLSLCLFELCVLSKLQHISNNPWQSWLQSKLHSHSQSASLSQSASSLQFLSSRSLSSVCICTMRTRLWRCIWPVWIHAGGNYTSHPLPSTPPPLAVALSIFSSYCPLCLAITKFVICARCAAGFGFGIAIVACAKPTPSAPVRNLLALHMVIV